MLIYGDRGNVIALERRARWRVIARTPPGDEVVVVATYTAMQALREALADLGHVGRFWED